MPMEARGIVLNDLGPLALTKNQENVPTDMPTGKSDEMNSSIEFPSSHVSQFDNKTKQANI